MNARERVAAGLATAALAGPWEQPALVERMTESLDSPAVPRWVRRLAADLTRTYRDAPADRPRELARYLQTTPSWTTAWAAQRRPRVISWTPAPTAIVRAPWPVTPLPDLGALARLLDVDQGELAWFADVRGWQRTCAEPLRHYRWTQLPKRGGGTRLVAAPKPRLKEIQRRLLRHVLSPIPVHDAAHGGVAGRSVRTAVAPHAGVAVVLRFDLTAFFASIPAARAYGLLRAAGLPEPVAHTTTGLLTTVVPRGVSRDPALQTPHLPQGAPSSTQLANLVAYSLDRRLTGLAARYGATYTRYVDDLTFSGGRSLHAARSRFVALVTDIVRDEGFAVNERKTVVLGDAGRQQVLGAVLNVQPAVPRPERDALRATLHNCATRGWVSQARGRSAAELRDHLLGRVAWVAGLHSEHGRRLRAIADRIDWGPDLPDLPDLSGRP